MLWGNAAQNSCLRITQFVVGAKLPWEAPEWETVFGRATQPTSCPGTLEEPPGGWANADFSVHKAIHSAPLATVALLRGTGRQAVPHPDDERETRMDQWRRIALLVGKACALGRQLLESDTEADQRELMIDTMFGKATSTLAKRASSFSLFLAWRAANINSFDCTWPVGEEAAYRYLAALARDGAPATRGKGFVEALFFADGAIGLPVLAEVRNSARIKGASLRSFERKRLTKKAPALKIEHVRFLEEEVIHGEDPFEVNMVGFILFVLYSRSRCRDASAIECDPALDVICTEAGTIGYSEATASTTKTTRGMKRRRLGVPIVAPAVGLVHEGGKSWAVAWTRARKAAQATAGAGRCLMPAIAPGGVASLDDVPMSAPQLTTVLRNALAKGRFPHEEVAEVSSHSLKATVLSWLAKAGVAKAARRLLGGHVKPGEKSVIEYSRDGLAGPLREIDRVLEMIRKGRFDPDATRSGRFIGDASPDGDSDSSTADDEGDSEQDPDEQASRDAEGLDALGSLVVDVPLPHGYIFVHHKASKIRHLKGFGELEELACGRLCGPMYLLGGTGTQRVCKPCLRAAARPAPTEDAESEGADAAEGLEAAIALLSDAGAPS